MRIKFTVLAGLVAFVASASTLQAATIVWSASQDNGFSLENGSNLAANNLIRLGTFDIAPDVIAANAFNIEFLNSHFIEFASGRIGDNLGGIGEHFARTDNAAIGSTGLNIAGAQTYMWVFSSANNSSAANSISTAQQHGIFAFDKSINSNWAIPSDEPVNGTATIDISDLTNPAGTALTQPGAQILVGTFNTGTSDQGGAANFGLKAVPEPTSAGLAIVGGVAMLLRRRRRG